VLGASALLNAAYFVPIIREAFWGQAPAEDHKRTGHERPESGTLAMLMVVPLTITAAVTLALFFFPGTLLDLAGMAAGEAAP